MPTVLALETSCDESAAAVVRQGRGGIELLAHGIASQVEEHAQWGGVVPEIASRRHVEALPYLVDRALQEAGIVLPVCGVAKKLEEIWLPNASFPLILPRSSEALFLVQRVRDEAHRVAISYQRGTRKRTLQTELTSVPGVGESVAKALLQRFKSDAQVRKATRQELEEVAGVGPRLAETVHSYFSQSTSEQVRLPREMGDE